jgi:hypothetical protein
VRTVTAKPGLEDAVPVDDGGSRDGPGRDRDGHFSGVLQAGHVHQVEALIERLVILIKDEVGWRLAAQFCSLSSRVCCRQ